MALLGKVIFALAVAIPIVGFVFVSSESRRNSAANLTRTGAPGGVSAGNK